MNLLASLLLAGALAAQTPAPAPDTLRNQLRENRRAIAQAMRAENPDATRIGQLMLDSKKLREQLRASRPDLRPRARARAWRARPLWRGWR